MVKKGKWEILGDKIHVFLCKRLKQVTTYFSDELKFVCRPNQLKIAKCFKDEKKFLGARRSTPRVTPTLATPLRNW